VPAQCSKKAKVAELVDALDLGSSGATCESSSLSFRTTPWDKNMSVSVEKTSNLGRRLTIEVPAAIVQKEEKNSLKELANVVRVDGGFRPGPARDKYIKDKYKKQLRAETVNKVLESTLGAALKEQNLRPVNTPNVEDLKDEEGKNLTYTVSFDVYPEIVLKDFSAVELEKEVAEITEEDIDSGVEKLQNQFATWVDITDRAAKNGDKVTIDFVGMLNGEPFANGSSENHDLELGSNSFIPGFEEGLVGVKAGAETVIDLTFPVDYGAKDLAGKAVQFKVTVKNIQAKAPVPVDADFAGRIGIEDKDPAKVRTKIRENMLKYLEDIVNTKLRDQALEKLYAVNAFELPESLVEREKHSMQHEQHGHGKEVSCDVAHGKELSAEEEAELTAQAKKRVTVGLLLNEIISQNKLEPEEARVLAKIRSMSLMYGGHAELIQKMYYESKELRQNIQNMVLTDQAADLIVKNATIKEKKSTFYGIVNAKSE
jgi:trigger factor